MRALRGFWVLLAATVSMISEVFMFTLKLCLTHKGRNESHGYLFLLDSNKS